MEQAPYILVVDDEELILRIIARALGRAGYRCDCAQDGFEAAKIAQEKRYDLILTDLTMPVLDGTAFVRTLRAGGPNVNTPVLVISCHAPPDPARFVQQHEVQGFLSKPFALDELLRSISAQLEHVAPTAPLRSVL